MQLLGIPFLAAPLQELLNFSLKGRRHTGAVASGPPIHAATEVLKRIKECAAEWDA